MGSEDKSGELKCAWIDEGAQIISFTVLPHTARFRAEESAFWEKISLLMRSGYRVQ